METNTLTLSLYSQLACYSVDNHGITTTLKTIVASLQAVQQIDADKKLHNAQQHWLVPEQQRDAVLESVAKDGRKSSQKYKMGILKEKELGEGLMEARKRDRNAKRM